jgi:hypothetical protein
LAATAQGRAILNLEIIMSNMTYREYNIMLMCFAKQAVVQDVPIHEVANSDQQIAEVTHLIMKEGIDGERASHLIQTGLSALRKFAFLHYVSC